MAEAGHNSKPRRGTGNGEAVAADRLRAFVQRIERLEEEKAALAADISEIYKEAKGEGFDVTVLRQVIKRRKRDPADIQEQDALLELYLSALGDFASAPLGRAAIDRVTGSPGVKAAMRDLKELARQDGATISMQAPGGEPVTL